MKNTEKIRELLKKITDMLAGGEHGFSYQKLYDWAADASALLPCEICQGTKEISQPMPKIPHPCTDVNLMRAVRVMTCPDCKEKKT